MYTRPLPRIKMRHFYRFNSYRVVGPEESCWIWIGGRLTEGYGVFNYENQSYPAHRIAYFLEYGIDPGDKMVCHDCDNPPCCNPSHLFLGTSYDNQMDALVKGRRSDSKLDEDLVKTILLRSIRGETGKAIAPTVGLSEMTISRVIRREIWAHVRI